LQQGAGTYELQSAETLIYQCDYQFAGSQDSASFELNLRE
jgi:hypothetical protein